jgi:hypothetical protein
MVVDDTVRRGATSVRFNNGQQRCTLRSCAALALGATVAVYRGVRRGGVHSGVHL